MGAQYIMGISYDWHQDLAPWWLIIAQIEMIAKEELRIASPPAMERDRI
jgi:hypothetical protein